MLEKSLKPKVKVNLLVKPLMHFCRVELIEFMESQVLNLVEFQDLVFCYQNCSVTHCEKNCFRDGEELLKFKAEGQEFEFFLRSLGEFMKTERGYLEQFLKQNVF